MYSEYNPNPKKRLVGDCVIRALTKLLHKSWEDIYIDLAIAGYKAADMPSANHVWGKYLEQNGYKKTVIPDTCPDCYTIEKFCTEHKDGYYLVATGSHVVTVIDGIYFDAWDSGQEIPVYFYERKNINESNE